MGSAPEVREGLEDLTVVSPAPATLEARITPGDPKATFSWYRDNKEVYAGPGYEMRYDDMMATLVIKESQLSDGGYYRCEAANKIGKCQTEACLTVHRE